MGGPSVLQLSSDNSIADRMSDPERYKLESDYTLADVLEHPEYKCKTELSYEYDHGDSWEHDIIVLGRADSNLRNALGGVPHKAFCIAGEGHPCAEDAGSYSVSCSCHRLCRHYPMRYRCATIIDGDSSAASQIRSPFSEPLHRLSPSQ